MNQPPRHAPRVTVVLPTYNEALNIGPMIRGLRAALGDPEILVVDDDSPDRTWEAAAAAGARGIRRERERGLASALSRGVSEAAGDVVLWMDCDLSMPPGDAPRLVQALECGADIAVGSRYAPGGRDARPWPRRLASRAVNALASLLLPVRVRDCDSGFVAVKKHVFQQVPLSPIGYGEYCIEFLCRAGLLGYRIQEVGYTFSDRAAGRSKTAPGLIPFLVLGMQYVRRILRLRAQLKKSVRAAGLMS